ncbi:hypothetical protein A3C67_02170 [Candidatus Nomurabacteria bacterium RIFCSPHIGHO2_02_FULL_42_19]|uniref:Uncharacterized protein n=1 Tax=Candidatus Nomurabacteria bacterium RIFCSPHIGHO2_02_FULL_42_19 TaxID=1801756 RepID=A0A1F6W3R1_9BACT|nr:MAG: hypothetical protein A3C67_02170 [Candidatus Nomurabacteria bacterium RIFCSPHIGHO2_02_FULL_42_19]
MNPIKSFQNKKRGISILGVLLLGVIIILVVSYFNISVQSVVESPETQKNFNYVASTGRNIWHNYLKRPISYVWNDIVYVFGHVLRPK